MKVDREVHVHEHNASSLRKVARMADLADSQIWVGEDILRSGEPRHTQSLSVSPVAKSIARMSRLGPVRFAFGDDLYPRHGK